MDTPSASGKHKMAGYDAEPYNEPEILDPGGAINASMPGERKAL